jgi:hypothetical protein
MNPAPSRARPLLQLGVALVLAVAHDLVGHLGAALGGARLWLRAATNRRLGRIS